MTRGLVFARNVVALALVAAAGSCALFVPSAGDLRTDVCDFKGSSTACGKCVASKCADELDGCCVDSTCSGALTGLDACASSSSVDPCNAFVLPGGAPAGLGVRACVGANCMADCAPSACGVDDLPQTDCRDCIAKSCKAELQKCCADPSGACALHLEAVRRCATDTSASSCTRVAPEDLVLPTAGLALSQCIADHCASSCPIDDAYRCVGVAATDCAQCCSNAFKDGFQKSYDLDKECACGPCASVCSDSSYCNDSGGAASQACTDCIVPTSFWGDGCRSNAKCYVDDGCAAYSVCFSRCIDKAK